MVINEGERCSLEKQGFVGVYYPGTYRTDRAIIASGGASCDEKLSVAMSRFLRDTGYNVLVLGFYMWEGLPDTLVSIPVDYAERAVHWLKDEKKIQSVAMTAASTGAGYTLLSASLIPLWKGQRTVLRDLEDPYTHGMDRMCRIRHGL